MPGPVIKKARMDNVSDVHDINFNGDENNPANINNHANHTNSLLWQVCNKEGYSPLSLYHPYDVTFLWDNRVAVVEGFWPYSRIQILNNTGKSLMKIGQGSILPFGVAMDAEGYLAVTDHKDRTVKFFTPDGDTALSWQNNMFDWPDGIAINSNGHYVITDWSKGQLSSHDTNGLCIRSFSTVDTNGASKSCPMYVTIDHMKRILVTDSFDCSVKIFDLSGKKLLTFGNCEGNNSVGSLIEPRGICIDQQNNIIVADWGANCIRRFSPDGKLIEDIITSEGEATVQHPWGVATNQNGLLLVTEQNICKKNPKLKMFRIHP